MHEVTILGISGVQQNTTCFVVWEFQVQFCRKVK